MVGSDYSPLLSIITVMICVSFSTISSLQNESSLALTNNFSSNNTGNGLKPSTGGELSNARTVYNTQTMTVQSSSVRSVIITIIDEAHEPPESSQKHISDHNSFLLPTNLIIPQGVSVSILDADAPWDSPHPHTIKIMEKESKKIIYTTGRLDYTNSSKKLVLPVGDYIIADTKYQWIRGNISVSSSQKVAVNADLVLGGFYTTTNRVLDNKDNDGGVHPGWLGYYRTEFPMNQFQLLSEFNFHYSHCKYCPSGYWPDLKSADHTLLVYITAQPLSEALSNLAKMVWNNVYI